DTGSGFISAPGTLGNIGGELLSRCRVTFDYGKHRVFFEPTDEFAKPFNAEMLGAAMTRDSTGYVVRIVVADTPAAEVGWRAGDRVVDIDGPPARRIDPNALRKMLQTEGRTLPIHVKRGDQDTTVTVVLRKII